MAGEIERLEADVVALTASVDKAVALIAELKGVPARVGAASDAIESATSALDTATA